MFQLATKIARICHFHSPSQTTKPKPRSNKIEARQSQPSIPKLIVRKILKIVFNKTEFFKEKKKILESARLIV